MECEIEETGFPSPPEVGALLRELAPELCAKFNTLSAFREYVWTDKTLKKIRVHPRQEMFAKCWCNPPYSVLYGGAISSATFALYVDPTMPEYEMHLIYKDGRLKTIKLD